MFIDIPVGIDLGTTNSGVALLDPSERDLVVYADRFGRKTIPSAVAWDPKTSELVVGRKARGRRGGKYPPTESIKRRMGRDVSVEIGPERMTPTEISSRILGELRERMLEHLSARSASAEVRVGRAVITVPAYFDAPQVEATRAAGIAAGLDVLGVLQEPTAAAIYHTFRHKLKDGCFLVYDLGGGTFDVSILRCLAGEYQVLAIDGDNYLGGDDFDRRFAEHLRTLLVSQGYTLELNPDDPDDADRLRVLRHLAQEIKEGLSTAEVAHISKQNIMADQSGEPVDFEREIGRSEWEEVNRDLVTQTLNACRSAIEQAETSAAVGLDAIDHVVLVGGSTRVPLVIDMVTSELCAHTKSPTPLQEEVDTCVAQGAAIYAAQLGGLRLGDSDCQLCVHGRLVGNSDTLSIALDVERTPDQTTSLQVLRSGSEQDKEAERESLIAEHSIEETPGRLKLKLPLEETDITRYDLVFAAEDGRALSSLEIALYRGERRPRASALSQPAVIAKDISIEVLRAGRRERKVLFGRGTGLPNETSQTFYTGDKSGAVVLRILQDRLPIKTLMVPVSTDLPVGTEVSVTLKCDEAMKMDARAVVAGQELWARVEPSPQKMPNAEEVQTLLSRAETSMNALWGHDAHMLRREVEPLTAGIREVIGADPDKLAVLCARLEELLGAYSGPEGSLSPPMPRFEGLMDALRRTVYRSGDTLLDMDRAQWEGRIEDLITRGDRAWQEQNRSGWRRVNDEAQALLETVSEREFAKLKLNDPAYIERLFIGMLGRAKQIEAGLLDFIPSVEAEVRDRQLQERDKQMALLKETVLDPLSTMEAAGDPRAVRNRLNEVRSHLDRAESSLEQLPSLGLVTERGVG